MDSSSRKGRKGGEDAAPADGAVFDQWEAANTGGLGGVGSVTRQKVYRTGRKLILTIQNSGCLLLYFYTGSRLVSVCCTGAVGTPIQERAVTSQSKRS